MAATADRQTEALDALAGAQRAEAIGWAERIAEVARLAELSEQERKVSGTPQYLVLELAGTCRVGQGTASRWLAEAQHFVQALPLTLSLLASGELWVAQARVLLSETFDCEAETARLVEADLLPRAAELCPSDLRRKVRARVRRFESDRDAAAAARHGEAVSAAEQRLANARAARRTFTRPGTDGMGLAGAVLAAESLATWRADLDQLQRLEQIADRAAGVERTADQRRADLFVALPAMVLAARTGLGSPEPGASRAAGSRLVCNITVPCATVLGLSHEPAELHGYGPTSAEHVRLLLPVASLRRVLTDAETGQPLSIDDRVLAPAGDAAAARERVLAMIRPSVAVDAAEGQHDPSAPLSRLVDLRDVRCAGPGCGQTRCHRDHRLPYPAGPTAAWNLNLLSERCHAAKHAGWTMVRQLDGSTTWVSPLSRRYFRPPPHDPPPSLADYPRLPPLARPASGVMPSDSGQAWAAGEPPTDAEQVQPAGPDEPADRGERDDEPPF